jgi:membrane protein implicated in regulation of membrane protease activity
VGKQLGEYQMPWWGWLILGGILFGAELGLIDAAFYLVFLGLSALLVGLLMLFGLNMEMWLQWLVFAGLSLGSMVFFRVRVYRWLHPPGLGYDTSHVGEELLITARIAPGESARIAYKGTTWTVRNNGQEMIEAGERASIEKVDSLTILVKK